MALIIGLTGGIATGKSTVSKMFVDYGIPVIDSDLISFNLLKKGSIAYGEVITLFGEEILFNNGEVNRKKIAKKIFEDNTYRQKLNDIIHPKVRAIVTSEIKKYEEVGESIIVIDVPLLFETDFTKFIDKSIVVYTTTKLQMERLIDRDSITEEYAILKIGSQIPIDEKVKLADFVIDNTESILTTKKGFNEIVKILSKNT